jgi:hypothetical protein
VTADEQVEEVARMWREQVRRPAPLPRDPYGFDVMEIDSFSAGCIDAFLKSPARFMRDKKRLEALRSCFEDINQLWDGLDADQKEYLGPLQKIVSEILMWHARKTHGKRA